MIVGGLEGGNLEQFHLTFAARAQSEASSPNICACGALESTMIAAETSREPGHETFVIRPPFDRVTIAVHWTTVLLVLAFFVVALARSQVQDEASATAPLTLHCSLAVNVWRLTALRLGSWAGG
jgi:hypothetical protein